ncbi:stretch-activated ca2+-permeable channel component domain-containing protein [Sarocladium implicatum]|nr:stretch-activated ca2+-permeable channel component domain-containing protein [Sarocladium implicatum]
MGDVATPSNAVRRAYEPEFGLFDRGIVGRAQGGVTPLENNAPKSLNLSPGQSACYVVDKDTLSKGKEVIVKETTTPSDGIEERQEEGGSETPQSRKRVFLSANTCLQPQSTQKDKPTAQPPQLSITISQSEDGGCAQSLAGVPESQQKEFREGAVMFQANATAGRDLYVSIVAPAVENSSFTGVYNFELAASTDMWYHTYNEGDSSELLWMDSDSSAALLVTNDLTTDSDRFQQVMSAKPPYVLYAENEARNHTGGLRASVCGLNNTAQILANGNGDGMLNQLCRTGMTTRGPGGFPKQQFYFDGLNATSSYIGILYKPSESKGKRDEDKAGGGGTIFPSISFQTVQGKNCKVSEGPELEFCDEVNWAMPGNDELNNTELGLLYDNYARDMYENFKKVLAQIPCEAPPDQQYSLARTCADCERAYKRWLCTVTIPRCEDIYSPNQYGVMRNIGKPFPNGTKLPEEMRVPYEDNPYFNSARNRELDDKIKPGPYKEILPCDDICYEVVQSCPAAMEFACPRPGGVAFNISYAEREPPGSQEVRCSFPGQSRTRKSSAPVMLSPARLLFGFMPTTALLLLLL